MRLGLFLVQSRFLRNYKQVFFLLKNCLAILINKQGITVFQFENSGSSRYIYYGDNGE